MKTVLRMLPVVFLIACAGLQPHPIYTNRTDSGTGNKTTETIPITPPDTPPNREIDYDLLREKLMVEIEDLLGVPYRVGGTTPRGMDCSGFVYYVFNNALNLPLPRRVSDLYHTGVAISSKELQFGDLVFFKSVGSTNISHVGIYLDAGQFAHATLSKGVIISSLEEAYYKKRYMGARRVIQ